MFVICAVYEQIKLIEVTLPLATLFSFQNFLRSLKNSVKTRDQLRPIKYFKTF